MKIQNYCKKKPYNIKMMTQGHSSTSSGRSDFLKLVLNFFRNITYLK